MTFGGEFNYRMERIVFDVAEIPLAYNGLLGRPTLAKFMAASHYAYNTLKMPGPMTIILVPSDTATAAKALAPAAEAPGGKGTSRTSRT